MSNATYVRDGIGGDRVHTTKSGTGNENGYESSEVKVTKLGVGPLPWILILLFNSRDQP